MKAMKEKYTKLPAIIGFSAYAMEGDSEKYKEIGMDDYMTKPASVEKFTKMLTKWVKK